MVIVYGILVIGAVSSFLNYRLQKNWFDITMKEKEAEYKLEPKPKDKND